jgi:hypothetical protein
MKKVKLNVTDRVWLPQILPCDSLKTGPLRYSLLKMSLLADIKKTLKFSPEEIEICEMTENEMGDLLFFDRIEKEFEFSDKQIEIFKEGILQADQEERISEKMYEAVLKIDPIE